MPLDPELRDLVRRVAAFHLTQREIKDAQRDIEAAFASGAVSEEARASYLRAVRRYFESFDREARAQLRDVDKRLERVNQVHFNLTAERGVAVKRIEATSAVLATLAKVDGDPR